MKPIIGYPGGKYKLRHIILKQIPSHKTYLEPFFGGGSIYFAKQPAQVNVIADINKQLINFYKQFRDSGCRGMSMCPSTRKVDPGATSRLFQQAKKGKANNICSFYTTRYLSVNNNGTSVSPTVLARSRKGIGKVVLKNCKKYEDKLKKTRILSDDFRNVVKKYDSKDTFIYLDPPYRGRANGLYKHENVTPQEVRDG